MKSENYFYKKKYSLYYINVEWQKHDEISNLYILEREICILERELKWNIVFMRRLANENVNYQP